MLTISFKDSSADAWPMSCFAPAPKPLVKLTPNCMFVLALFNF